MSRLDPAKLDRVGRYRLVIGSVVPRPIAWITTVGNDGVVNLAPFSYFMGVGSSPPTVAVSIGPRDPVKDTLRNLVAAEEGVVHLVPPDQINAVNQTGAEYPADSSEVAALGLATLPSERVSPPRLACADVALECRLHQRIEIGAPATSLCVLEIVLAHVRDEVALEDGFPDPDRLRAVARLGERAFLGGEAWQVVHLPRPEAP